MGEKDKTTPLMWWSKIDAGEFLKDTQALTYAHVGAYLLLYLYLISHEYFPDHMPTIRRICRGARGDLSPPLQLFTKVEGKGYHHPKLTLMRKSLQHNATSKSEAGKAGAKARWKNHKQKEMQLTTKA